MKWKWEEDLTLQSDWSIFCSLPQSHAGHTHTHKKPCLHTVHEWLTYYIYTWWSSHDTAFVSKDCFANCCWCIQWNSNLCSKQQQVINKNYVLTFNNAHIYIYTSILSDSLTLGYILFCFYLKPLCVEILFYYIIFNFILIALQGIVSW